MNKPHVSLKDVAIAITGTMEKTKVCAPSTRLKQTKQMGKYHQGPTDTVDYQSMLALLNSYRRTW